MAFIDDSNNAVDPIDALIGSPDMIDDCDIPAGYAHMDSLLDVSDMFGGFE